MIRFLQRAVLYRRAAEVLCAAAEAWERADARRIAEQRTPSRYLDAEGRPTPYGDALCDALHADHIALVRVLTTLAELARPEASP